MAAASRHRLKRFLPTDVVPASHRPSGALAFAFGVRLAWHPKNKSEQVLASKVTARTGEGECKRDAEHVKSVSRTAAESDYGDAGDGPAFNPFNPPADLIDPDLEHLRGDIGIRPGRGCAVGRCGK